MALEGASFINVYGREDARKLAEKLPNPSDKLEETAARQVAMSQDINAVITGEIDLRGDEYEVSVTALDGDSGKVLAHDRRSASPTSRTFSAACPSWLPRSAKPWAIPRRTRSSSKRSAEVLLQHPRGCSPGCFGVDEQFAGKFQEAFDSFQKAAQLDPNFPRPYTGMAAMAQNLGRP